MSRYQKLILVAIMLLAIFFRYFRIAKYECGPAAFGAGCRIEADMPGGLFPDEAANGLDVNLMQQGHLQPFYERGNGREALFFYMEWASASIFGHGVWQFHIVSALIGVLSVWFCFLAARRLFMMDAFSGFGEAVADEERRRKIINRATNIALLAAFLMAVSTWHTVLSRTAFRAILTPLFGAATLYFLIRTYQAQSRKAQLWLAGITGAVYALGWYTYIAYRIMFPILIMLLVWPLIAAKARSQLSATLKRYVIPFVIFIVAFVAVVFPLADYFIHHPDSFSGRGGQVSLFNQTLYTINGRQLAEKLPLSYAPSVFAEVAKTAITGFFTHGDLNWRQNISGYPFLSPLISPFFGVGLLLTAMLGIWYFFAPGKRSKYWKYYLLTGWFWGMLLPELATAEGIPHGLRSAGAIPPTFIITAVALYEFAQLMVKLHNRLWSSRAAVPSMTSTATWPSHSVKDKPRGYRVVNIAAKILVVCFAVALTMQTYYLYFVYAYNSPANFYSFRSDLTPVSEYLNQYGNKADTYLVLDTYSVQTTDYLTTVDGAHPDNPRNIPYVDVDPASSWQLKLKPGDQVVFTQSTIFDITKFKQYHPEAHLYLEARNKFGQAVLAVYKVY